MCENMEILTEELHEIKGEQPISQKYQKLMLFVSIDIVIYI